MYMHILSIAMAKKNAFIIHHNILVFLYLSIEFVSKIFSVTFISDTNHPCILWSIKQWTPHTSCLAFKPTQILDLQSTWKPNTRPWIAWLKISHDDFHFEFYFLKLDRIYEFGGDLNSIFSVGPLENHLYRFKKEYHDLFPHWWSEEEIDSH